MSCLRTNYNVPSQGSNTDRSSSALTVRPPRLAWLEYHGAAFLSYEFFYLCYLLPKTRQNKRLGSFTIVYLIIQV